MMAEAKPAAAKPGMSDDEKDFQARQDLHHMIEYQRIKQDPERHKRVMEKHQQLTAALNQAEGARPRVVPPVVNAGPDPSQFAGGAQ